MGTILVNDETNFIASYTDGTVMYPMEGHSIYHDVGKPPDELRFCKYENGEIVIDQEFKTQTIVNETKTQNLAATDKDFIRVIEDIMDTLEAKGIITLADLPQQAQGKINARKALRGG